MGLDARKMDEDEYAYQLSNTYFCMKTLGYMEKKKGYNIKQMG